MQTSAVSAACATRWVRRLSVALCLAWVTGWGVFAGEVPHPPLPADPRRPDLTQAMLAARAGDTEYLQQLQKTDPASIDEADKWGATPLFHAVQMLHQVTALRLIEAGADIKHIDGKGRTALHYAAMRNEAEVIKALLEHGAAIDSKDEQGYTPFEYCARGDDFGIWLLLIEHGADPNAVVNGRVTVLQLALLKGMPEPLVRRLVAKGADPNKLSANRTTTLSAYLQDKDAAICKLLLEVGADGNGLVENSQHQKVTPLVKACQGGQTEIVKLLLAHGARAVPVAGEDPTPLLAAVQSGKSEIVNAVIQAGGSPCCFPDGPRAPDPAVQAEIQPFVTAFQNNDLATVDLLVTACGEYPLPPAFWQALAYSAAEDNQTPALVYLINHGLDVTGKDPQGQHLFLQLIRLHHLVAAQTFAEHGATLNGGSAPVSESLYEAMLYNRLDTLVFLLEHGAIAATPGILQQHELLYRFLEHAQGTRPSPQILHVVQLMLEHGADVTPTGAECNALLMAVKMDSPELVQLLLKYGADPNVEPFGFSALGKVLETEFLLRGRQGTPYYRPNQHTAEILELLLQSGADPNRARKRGYSDFELLCTQYPMPEYVPLLVQYGANPHASNAWRTTPMQLAEGCEHYEIMAALYEVGGIPGGNQWYPAPWLLALLAAAGLIVRQWQHDRRAPRPESTATANNTARDWTTAGAMLETGEAERLHHGQLQLIFLRRLLWIPAAAWLLALPLLVIDPYLRGEGGILWAWLITVGAGLCARRSLDYLPWSPGIAVTILLDGILLAAAVWCTWHPILILGTVVGGAWIAGLWSMAVALVAAQLLMGFHFTRVQRRLLQLRRTIAKRSPPDDSLATEQSGMEPPPGWDTAAR